jgi:transposase
VYFQERKPLREVARAVGVSRSSVKRWNAAWQTGGVNALAAKPHPPRATELSEKQKLQLVKLLLSGPRAAGFGTDLWTCARVAAVVRRRFGVKCHPDYLGRILHDLGFSPQEPRLVAREQDPQAVERWRKQDWPRIKKKPSGVEPASSTSMKLAFVCSR